MAKPKIDEKKDVLGYIREGLTDKDACDYAGISQETFYAWLYGRKDKNGKVKTKPDPVFAESLKAARIAFKRLHIKNVTKVAIKDKQWTASAFLLERRFPDEFGQKIRTENEHVVRDYSAEAKKRLAKYQRKPALEKGRS